MNGDDLYIARKLFILKIHECDGQSFQDLFVQTMQKNNSDFRPVKPYGSLGDRKNDGFINKEGIYFQVYAPEDIRKVEFNKIIDKITTDFQGLLSYWQAISPIKKFFFVINDKFNGTYPTVEKCLSNLQIAHNIQCNPFLAKDLENIFNELSDDDKKQIIGCIPSAQNIINLPYGIMTEVVNFLINQKKAHSYDESLPDINFDSKIKFNNLSKQTEALLKVASYQVSAIDDFFKLNSIYTKRELQKIFQELYIDAKALYSDNPDLMFFHILTKASPSNTKEIQDCIIVLMAYYFEACDIFEEVKNDST